MSAEDFLDDIPIYLRPPSCQHILTSLEHYRGVVSGSDLPLGSHDVVDASVLPPENTESSASATPPSTPPTRVAGGVGSSAMRGRRLAALPSNEVFYKRPLPWTTVAVSAGRAARNELVSMGRGGRGRSHGLRGAAATSTNAAALALEDIYVAEIRVGDVVNAVVPGVAGTSSLVNATGVVDALLPDGTFGVRFTKPTRHYERVTRAMIKYVHSDHARLLPRLHPFNGVSDEELGGLAQVRSTNDQTVLRLCGAVLWWTGLWTA